VTRFPPAPGAEREIAVVRSGFGLASGDPEPATSPPSLGADTEKILAELGYDCETVARLREDGAL
jgi:crotonobetainyl-CoA:carnitine CoA-transferase CaiB-like acyl-CoA transferase